MVENKIDKMSQLLESQWGFTEINVKKSSYMWKIKNFSYAQDGVVYKSPSFVIDPKDTVKWYLDFYINGPTDTEEEGNITVFLNACIANATCTFDVEYTVAILDKNGEKYFEKTKKRKLTKTTNYGKIGAFVNRADIINNEELLINDTLTIHCDFVVISNCNNVSFDCFENADDLKRIALSDFENYLEEQEMCDVVLKASCGKTLKVHKFLLSARSPVFRAMFKTDMVENKNNIVKINDIEYNVLKELLRFIYAARVENLDILVVGILDAAEKYQVKGLKDICEDHLRKYVKIDNIVETLVLCNRFNMDTLKIQVANLMKMYAEDVIHTPGFKSIKDPDLLAEIVEILAIN